MDGPPADWPYRVRPAREADRAAVLAFCRGTFAWGDYIDEVWDEWLANPDGRMFVVEHAGEPVAVGNARLTSPEEAWLEGMRVHPAHRRQGIANAVNAAACAWARSRGAAIARLAVEYGNEAADRQVTRLDFERIAEFFHAMPAVENAGEAPVEPFTDLPLALCQSIESLVGPWRELADDPASGGLWAVGWAWRRRSEADLVEALARGRAWQYGNAFAILGGNGREPHVTWLGGEAERWPALLTQLRHDTSSRGETLHALLPASLSILEAIRQAGFVEESRYHVYASRLGPSSP